MTAPVQRKLPGTPIPRQKLIAEWEDRRNRNLLEGPVASFLFDLYYPEPEKTYQWRVQLDCGCVRDVLTHQHGDDKTADKVERLSELADAYYFRLVKPSEREIREANQQAGKQAEQAARAKFAGTDPPAEPNRPSIYGKGRLNSGQFLCHNADCTRYRSNAGSLRDIAEWVRLRDTALVTNR